MKIAELTPDDRNLNQGTDRGRAAVRESLERFGAGRSILIDRAGRVIAGNKTLEAAESAGINEIVVVPSDGTKIIAVQRTDLDLDDPAARELAAADNRTSELGLSWNAEMLKELSGDLDLEPFWSADELNAATGEGLVNQVSSATAPQGNYSEQYGVIVICKNEAEQQRVYEKLVGDGLSCRVVVT